MTSVQTKKDTKDQDRQTILKQMKVRTKLKTDKSWIHQDSEEEKEKVSSPLSPQLKALEGRKFLWSPTPESDPDRNSETFTAKETITRTSSSPIQSSNRTSGVFTAKEIVASSPSPPVQSSNKQFSYSSAESGSKSPPPSTTGNKPSSSYIIRGQPVNSVSQVKSPTFSNGFQKSQVQARTTSLPRVHTATGYKMSTDEYKKLAPYNVRNKSGDLSDDETLFTPEEQVKRTEQASSVLRNTTSKERSYVISAAKRNSGVGTQDSGNPFLAKRVEIKDDEPDTSRKSQTLPKTLPSYPTEDTNRYENWKDIPSKQTSTQSSTSRVTERSSSPKLTSYNMTTSSVDGSSPVKPESGKISVRGERAQSLDDLIDIKITNPTSTNKGAQSLDDLIDIKCTNTTSTNKGVPERSSSPRLTSYSMTSSAADRSSSVKPEVGKITVVREESHKDSKDVSKAPTEKDISITVHTSNNDRVEVGDKKHEAQPTSLEAFLAEDARSFQSNWKANQNVQPTSQTSLPRVEVKNKKDEAQPKSLDSYLFEDASRFENNWKTNQTVQPTSQTSPARVEVKEKKDETGPKSLDSYLFEDASRFENNFKANQSNQPTLQPSPARVPDRPESPKLTSWKTESGYSTIRPEPGKITVLRQESEKMTPQPTENTSSRTVTTTFESGNIDIPKVTSFSDITEKSNPTIQAGPGKITVLRQESDQEPPKMTPQVSSTTRTVESNKDSPDIPILTTCSISETLTENTTPIMQAGPGKITILREDSTSPTPAPRSETKPKDTTSSQFADLISWSDLDSNAENRLPVEKPVITPTPVPRNTNKDRSGTEGRHRVLESLDDPELINSKNPTTSNSRDSNVKISIETLSDDPTVPPKIERISSPSIASKSENRNVKISIETLPEQPQTTVTPKTERSSSPRPTPRSREGTMNSTVSESRYRVPEILDDTMPQPTSNRSSWRTKVNTTHSTDPLYTEYQEERTPRSTRTITNSTEKYTTTTVETHYDDPSYRDESQYDPQSASNKGVLFVKEYVNSRESLKSPTIAGSLPNYSGDSEKISYSNNSGYLYSSAQRRGEEGPCTYCGREIKDCAKIMLDHLNIYCHEYCFKCGICHKPMGDLVDSIFIHRDVVHCESCYEKLF